jgi:hypothetical protein
MSEYISRHSPERESHALSRGAFIALSTAALMAANPWIASTTIETHTQRITGADMDPCLRWQVCGTDLGVVFEGKDGVDYAVFGDTFSTRDPAEGHGWRSPVMLRTSHEPSLGAPLVYESAVGIDGDGMAPEVIQNGHNNGEEFTVIPNDGVTLPNGQVLLSYQSVRNWEKEGTANWRTNYTGLAVSSDGNSFSRNGPMWPNDEMNRDPFQMQSMQLDGDWVYMISVRAGRQSGPMMLQRVPWEQALDLNAYQCWNGSDWARECEPILRGRFGEPSLRKLEDGIWAMSYLNISTGDIVTRTADSPTGPWSDEKVQIPDAIADNGYGGSIYYGSTKRKLTLFVSNWSNTPDDRPERYDVSQFNGTL